MNKYVKEFFHRGLMFSGFGPMVLGIVYVIISYMVDDFALSGWEVLVAILSTYLIAFVQAGTTVFNQIEHWTLPKSLMCHFATLYVAYVLCYLINTWIPFDINVILVFTAIFVVSFFAIWIIVYLCVKSVTKRMNSKIG